MESGTRSPWQREQTTDSAALFSPVRRDGSIEFHAAVRSTASVDLPAVGPFCWAHALPPRPATWAVTSVRRRELAPVGIDVTAPHVNCANTCRADHADPSGHTDRRGPATDPRRYRGPGPRELSGTTGRPVAGGDAHRGDPHRGAVGTAVVDGSRQSPPPARRLARRACGPSPLSARVVDRLAGGKTPAKPTTESARQRTGPDLCEPHARGGTTTAPRPAR